MNRAPSTPGGFPRPPMMGQQSLSYRPGMYSANSTIVQPSQMYPAPPQFTPTPNHSFASYGVPYGAASAPAYGTPASAPASFYPVPPPQYGQPQAYAGYGGPMAPGCGFYSPQPPPPPSTAFSGGLRPPQSGMAPMGANVYPFPYQQAATPNTPVAPAPMGVPAPLPPQASTISAPSSSTPMAADLESNTNRFRLTSANRKEGWHLLLNQNDRKIVENFFVETADFDREFDKFENQFKQLDQSTASLQSDTVKNYKVMWSDWKTKLLERRRLMIQLQEQKLNQLYQKVCQNFPLFVTKDALPGTLKTASEPEAVKIGQEKVETSSIVEKTSLYSQMAQTLANRSNDLKPQISISSNVVTSTLPAVANLQSAPAQPPSIPEKQQSEPAKPLSTPTKRSPEELKKKLSLLREFDGQLQKSLSPFFNNTEKTKMHNELSFVRGEMIFIDKIMRETKSFYRGQKIIPTKVIDSPTPKAARMPNKAGGAPLMPMVMAKPVSTPTPIPQIRAQLPPRPQPVGTPKILKPNNPQLGGPPKILKPNNPRGTPKSIANTGNVQKAQPNAKTIMADKKIEIKSQNNQQNAGSRLKNNEPKTKTVDKPIPTLVNQRQIQKEMPAEPKSNSDAKVDLVPQASNSPATFKIPQNKDPKMVDRDARKQAAADSNQSRLNNRQRGAPQEHREHGSRRFNENRDWKQTNAQRGFEPRENDFDDRNWGPPRGELQDGCFFPSNPMNYDSHAFSQSSEMPKQFYSDPGFFTMPRKLNEEPLYIEDLLNEPGRSYRPAKIVFIIRGLPGSGKSHIAQLLKQREESYGLNASCVKILTIDDYFMVDKLIPGTQNRVAVYEHDTQMESEHKLSLFDCFRRTLYESFASMVIVDSINLAIVDVRNFYTFAIEHAYIPYVIEMEAIVRRLLDDCIHGEEVIAYCYKHNRHGRQLAEIRKLYEDWEILPSDYLRVNAHSLVSLHHDLEDGGVTQPLPEIQPTTSDLDFRPQAQRENWPDTEDFDYRRREGSERLGAGSKKLRDFWYHGDNELSKRYRESLKASERTADNDTRHYRERKRARYEDYEQKQGEEDEGGSGGKDRGDYYNRRDGLHEGGRHRRHGGNPSSSSSSHYANPYY